MGRKMRYCGREFTLSEFEAIRRLMIEHPRASRATLSRLLCEQLGWRRPDGRLKDMSGRVAMLRMQDDGLVRLPPPRNGNNNGRPYRRRTPQAEPDLFPVFASAGALADLHLELVSERAHSHRWNEYIDRYHYLGYQPLPGAQLRYFARTNDRVLALLGFGAAAWKTAPRDRFIGWTAAQRERGLHLVVNNARFLILPWVHCRNLASRLLSMATRRLADDWQQRYGYHPVLVETFVETPRFCGTCYKAANWIYLGETQGRGKLDVEHKAQLPKKAIWLHPLVRHFRRQLCC
ncbi:MAG: DUF4338 domain-containing protein [Deltaproteobacteria bacterium]|nr:DUF4338 domain-containing protein [Deltaproteobacteria bacterium]